MKTYKAVLKSSLVMLVLFAVAGSGVAQAQECIARAVSPGMVRAEGITEVVANIELKCRPPEATFGFNQVPERLDIAIELNARITNGISETRVVEVTVDGGTPADVLGYKSRKIDLTAFELTDTEGTVGTTAIPDSVFMGVDATGLDTGAVGGKLSEDSRTIVWANVATGEAGPATFEPPSDNLNLDEHHAGFQPGYLRDSASMPPSVGDGEDITAECYGQRLGGQQISA